VFSVKRIESDDSVLLGSWYFSYAENIVTHSTEYYPDTADNKLWITLTDSSTVLLDGYCNGGMGSHEVYNETINFTDLSMTEMGCLINIWEDYLYELASAEKYIIKQNTLTFILADDSRLVFLRETM
jgi:heat shock protein HslJ